MLRRFYRWLKDPNDEQYPQEVSWIKISKKNGRKILPEEILSEEDVATLVRAADLSRDKAFVSMLMIVMFVVAGMSLPAMALLAIMITLEKALLKGARWFTALISAVFITLGLIALISPDSIMMILT
jgi:site-specific recombinase XerD